MPACDKVIVYDDGNCAFCQWSESWVKRFDREDRIKFRSYHDPGVRSETPFTLEQLQEKMHVRTADDRWQSGYFGWMAVLAELPRFRRLSRILSLPPLRWLGPALYLAVARNRYRIPRFLLRWLGAPSPCGSQCALPEVH
jgi:predicted DCC family thiol-disulfide oxidoreductase YuxK